MRPAADDVLARLADGYRRYVRELDHATLALEAGDEDAFQASLDAADRAMAGLGLDLEGLATRPPLLTTPLLEECRRAAREAQQALDTLLQDVARRREALAAELGALRLAAPSPYEEAAGPLLVDTTG